jgi:hypothetical protein
LTGSAAIENGEMRSMSERAWNECRTIDRMAVSAPGNDIFNPLGPASYSLAPTEATD